MQKNNKEPLTSEQALKKCLEAFTDTQLTLFGHTSWVNFIKDNTDPEGKVSCVRYYCQKKGLPANAILAIEDSHATVGLAETCSEGTVLYKILGGPGNITAANKDFSTKLLISVCLLSDRPTLQEIFDFVRVTNGGTTEDPIDSVLRFGKHLADATVAIETLFLHYRDTAVKTSTVKIVN